MAKSLNPANKVGTTAHLTGTIANELAHVLRHFNSLKKAKSESDRQFHIEHIEKHLNSGVEHTAKLNEHLKDNYPLEGKELTTLEAVRPETHRQKVIKMAAQIGMGK